MKRRSSCWQGLCFSLILAVSGCGYGTVSPETYELAKAIYGVCNRQQTEKLPQVRELIETSLEKQEITEKEAQWLKDIVKQAEAGQWETAAAKARRIVSDQTKPAR